MIMNYADGLVEQFQIYDITYCTLCPYTLSFFLSCFHPHYAEKQIV